MSAKPNYELDAQLRDDQGKGASRRLRRLQNKIPAILYGGGEAPVSITLDHQKLLHALEHESFYSHLLTLNLAGKKQQVILKDLQRHHYKKSILHMDLFRVKPTDIICMRIPIHFMGAAEAPGVKDSKGIIQHHLSDIEVRCQAQALPEFIEVDISKMVLDQIIHISDLRFPKGVEANVPNLDKEHDHAVISIHSVKVASEEMPEEETTDTEDMEEGADAPVATAPKGKDNKPAPKAAAKAPAKPAAKPAAKSADKGKGKGK